jgi:hypothetical protein
VRVLALISKLRKVSPRRSFDSGLDSVQLHFTCGSAHSLFPLAAGIVTADECIPVWMTVLRLRYLELCGPVNPRKACSAHSAEFMR